MSEEQKSVKVILKHPRVLHDGTPGSSKSYGKGVHSIPESVAKHWFTKAAFKSGDIAMHVAPPGEEEEESEDDSGLDSATGDEADSDESEPGKKKKKKKKDSSEQ